MLKYLRTLRYKCHIVKTKCHNKTKKCHAMTSFGCENGRLIIQNIKIKTKKTKTKIKNSTASGLLYWLYPTTIVPSLPYSYFAHPEQNKHKTQFDAMNRCDLQRKPKQFVILKNNNSDRWCMEIKNIIK